MSTSDEELRSADKWEEAQSDQPRLHEIFIQHPELLEEMLVESRAFFNDYKASFVRQILRGEPEASMDSRCDAIRKDVQHVFSHLPPVDSNLVRELTATHSQGPSEPVMTGLIKLADSLELKNREMSKELRKQAVKIDREVLINHSLRRALNLIMTSYGRVRSLIAAGSVLREVVDLLADDSGKDRLDSDADLVRSMYLGILRREPDLSGREHLIKALSTGLPLHQAIRGMIESEEFAQIGAAMNGRDTSS